MSLAFPVTAQDLLELSLADGRRLAQQALLTGDPALAEQVALGLLQADRSDRAAWVILAAALPQLGRATEGRQAGRRAFDLSRTPPQKYEAARLTALAAANEDRLTLAQFWLRRAAIHAPDDEALAQTGQDFRGLRRLNPWTTHVQLGFAPSNNVNGGSDSAFNLIDGLPFIGVLSGDAQALSGFAASADLGFGRQISVGPEHRTHVSLRTQVRRVWLSEEAQEIATDSRNSDFGSTYLDLTAEHRQSLGPDSAAGLSLTLGGSWFGGELGYSFARGTLSVDQRVGERSQISGRVSHEQRFHPETWEHGDEVTALSLIGRWQTEGGALWSVSANHRDHASTNPNARHSEWTLKGAFRPADRIGPAQMTFGLGIGRADYPDYTILLPVPGGRQDERVFGSVELAFPDVSYAGFSPVVSFASNDSTSNVSRFERSTLTLDIGFRSSF